MTDQNKENESKELKPGAFLKLPDGSIKQTLFSYNEELAFPQWVLMNVQTGVVTIEYGSSIENFVVGDEGIPPIAKRLEAFERLTDERDSLVMRVKEYNKRWEELQDLLGLPKGSLDRADAVVSGVKELKESRARQVETINDRDQWTRRMCRALDLPGEGFSWRDKAIERAQALRDECSKWKDQLSEERKAYNALLNQTDEICAAVGVDSGKTSLDMVREAAKRVDLMCEQQDQMRKALDISATVGLVEHVQALKAAQHENARIEQMDEALEQSLMEIAQQAGVIAELRDELTRARNSIDDLIYDAANLKGQKEAYERALEIIGGSR